MLARDLMRREVLTIEAGESVATLMDVLVREHVHGLPVVDEDERLVGMVTQQDIFFATVPSIDRARVARTANRPRSSRCATS